MNRKTIFIAIAFGASVRDFLRTDGYRILKKTEDLRLVIFSQELSEAFINEFGGPNVLFERLGNYKPNLVERIILIVHRGLLRQKCRTIDLGNTSGNLTVLNLIKPLIFLMNSVFGYFGSTKLIGRCYKIFNAGTKYCSLFDKYNPSLVIVTRVLNYSRDYPLLKSASKKKVPTIALVSSWDNLTSKAFFPYDIASLVVWNNIMKSEAMNLYAFPAKKICISGAPRYDLYFNYRDFPPRTTFLKSFGLSCQKKTLLYATGSGTTTTSRFDKTSPEADICMYIAQAIEKKIIPDAQLVVRLHPQAIRSHYDQLAKSHPSVLLDLPGHSSGFQDRLFGLNDDLNYASWLKYSDVLINFGSTASLDAAVFDTPIVCANFDFRGFRPYLESPRKIYEFDHYANVLKLGGIKLSNSKDELISDINKSLEDPIELMNERQAIVSQQCFFQDGNSGKRIASHILKFLRG